jgi:hypothetical protein
MTTGRTGLYSVVSTEISEVQMSNLNVKTFLPQWVAIVTVAMTLATMGAFLTMWSVGEVVEETWGETAMALVVGGLFGALLAGSTGTAQAMVLYRQGINPGTWIVRTLVAGTVGMAIGMTVAFSFMDVDTMPGALIGLHFALSVGVPIGQVQSQLLKKHVKQARLWVLISAAAFAVGFGVGLPLSGEGREWLAVGTMAALTAIVSGTGLVWLARRQQTAVVV